MSSLIKLKFDDFVFLLLYRRVFRCLLGRIHQHHSHRTRKVLMTVTVMLKCCRHTHRIHVL
jgi:hypothetical protein